MIDEIVESSFIEKEAEKDLKTIESITEKIMVENEYITSLGTMEVFNLGDKISYIINTSLESSIINASQMIVIDNTLFFTIHGLDGKVVKVFDYVKEEDLEGPYYKIESDIIIGDIEKTIEFEVRHSNLLSYPIEIGTIDLEGLLIKIE